MTPHESQFLQDFGLSYLRRLEVLSISIFFYGAPSCSRYEAHAQVRYQECLLYSSLNQSLSSCSFSPLANLKSLISQQSPKLDRRKGFSNRATAAVFVATVINFLLSSLNIGIGVAISIIDIQKGEYYPSSSQIGSINKATRNFTILSIWASVPRSVEIFLSDFIVIWRARAAFQDRQWVSLIPFILWIGAVGE